MTEILSPIASIGGSIASIFRGGGGTSVSAAQLKPFKGTFYTPAYQFGGGRLQRTSPFIPSEEARLQGELGGLRRKISGFAQSSGTETSDRIRGAFGQIPGLFQKSEALRGQLGGLDVNLQGLATQVRPGFGRLTEDLRTQIRSQASEAIGNLRDSLARRGVLGSSFANDAVSRVQNEFLQTENTAVAQAFVEEMQLSRAIQGDRTALLQIGTGLLELDQQSLGEQARLIGLQLGLQDQQARLLALDLQAIQQDFTIVQNQANRELSELNIAGEFLKVVNQTMEETKNTKAQNELDDAGDEKRRKDQEEQKARDEQQSGSDIREEERATSGSDEREEQQFGWDISAEEPATSWTDF